MKNKSIIALSEQGIYSVTRWLNWISVISLIAAMIVVCMNVIGRGFFQTPLKGTVDICSLLGALIIAGAIPYTQVSKNHIRITILVDKLPFQIKRIVKSVIYLISCGLFIAISWQTILFADMQIDNGELSEVMKIPLGPFASFVAATCIAMVPVLLIDSIKAFTKEKEK